MHERVPEPGVPDVPEPAVRGGTGDVDGDGRSGGRGQAREVRGGAGFADGGADGLLQRMRQLRDVLSDGGPAVRGQAADLRPPGRVRGAGRQRGGERD